MRTAIWGMIQMDIRREGVPDKVIERCKRHGIETYLGYPFPFGEEDRQVLAYPSAIADGECENLLGPLASAGICIYHYDAMTDTDFDVFGKLRS